MGKDLTKVDKTVYVCTGGTCNNKGGMESLKELRGSLKMKGLHSTTHTIRTLCTGQCENGPIMMVYPDGVIYKEVDIATTEQIVDEHIVANKIVENKVFYQPETNAMHPGKWTDLHPNQHFQKVDDAEMGTVKRCKMLANEVNLYALLKTIFEKRHEAFSLNIPETGFNGRLAQATEVKFHEDKKAFLTIQNKNFLLEWLVAYLPETSENTPLIPQRITQVYFYEMEADNSYCIRFSDKKQRLKLAATFNSRELWQTLVKIYLELDVETEITA